MNFRRRLLDTSTETESFFEFARSEFALDLVHFWVAVEESKQVRPLTPCGRCWCEPTQFETYRFSTWNA